MEPPKVRAAPHQPVVAGSWVPNVGALVWVKLTWESAKRFLRLCGSSAAGTVSRGSCSMDRSGPGAVQGERPV